MEELKFATEREAADVLPLFVMLLITFFGYVYVNCGSRSVIIRFSFDLQPTLQPIDSIGLFIFTKQN